MCGYCGCSAESDVIITDLQTGRHAHLAGEHNHDHGHEREHGHDQVHAHGHDNGQGHHHSHGRTSQRVEIEQQILAKNRQLAERNRGWLEARGATALNVMSSPGAGKTTLLERTILDLGNELNFLVIEGDQATLRDAERIRATGSKVIQINTGAMCHLDADMTGRALRQLNPAAGSVLIIENVGNLVCPSMFDLGENLRVVVASVAEGDDKPEKYPHMFRTADVIVLNKIDLLPHVSFDRAKFESAVARLNPEARVFAVSATVGTGTECWYQWLRTGTRECGCNRE